MTASAHVLGALITGALALRDIDHVSADVFEDRSERRAFCVLWALLKMRHEGRAIPGSRGGLDLAFACRAVEASGVYLGGEWGDAKGRRTLGTLPDMARGAPRRRVALLALAHLEAAHCARHDAVNDRATFLEALADLVEDIATGFRRRALDDGGILCEGPSVKVRDAHERRWYVRPIEREAMPAGPALLRALAIALLDRAKAMPDPREEPPMPAAWLMPAGAKGHDPDSFIRAHGVEAVEALAREAQPLGASF